MSNEDKDLVFVNGKGEETLRIKAEGTARPFVESPSIKLEVISQNSVQGKAAVHTFQVTKAPEEMFRRSEFWRLRYADGSTADVANWHDVFEEGRDIGLLSVTHMVREITTREARIEDLKEQE